jgi:hypothetical protein
MLEEAFGHTPYPGDDNITIEGRDANDDQAQTSAWLIGRNWRSLKSSEFGVLSLALLTPEAFRYYLPAYILAAQEEESGIASHEVMTLLNPEFTPSDWFQLYCGDFTPTQKQVIQEWLDWKLEELRESDQEFEERINSEQIKLAALRDFWTRF